jgi:bifunctional DNase/RNase
MADEMVELRIVGVSMEEDSEAPLVLLEEVAGYRNLPVPVGPFEASAIIMGLEGIAPHRPLTHDLLVSFFREAGYSLERVELYQGDIETPSARLAYHRGLRRIRRDVRPSDALALALRLEVPILAESRLLKAGSGSQARASGEAREPRVLALADWRAKARKKAERSDPRSRSGL